MRQNITNKRKALHDQLRNQQIQMVFSEIRKTMLSRENMAEIYDLEGLLMNVPKTLISINQSIAFNQYEQNPALQLLIGQCQIWVQTCHKSLLSLSQWCQGMQILIKMLNYCQNSKIKQKIVETSEKVFCEKYFWLVEANRIQKYQMLRLMLYYYLTIIKWPCFLRFNSKYVKMIAEELICMNWKEKTKEFIKLICFLSTLIQRAIEEEYQILIYQIFIDDSSIVVRLMGVIQELYYCRTAELNQGLFYSILRILINLTYAIRDHSLTKKFMLTSFKQFLIESLNDRVQKMGKQYFLQLLCNIMVDELEFREFVVKNLDLQALASESQLYIPFLQDIKSLCFALHHN